MCIHTSCRLQCDKTRKTLVLDSFLPYAFVLQGRKGLKSSLHHQKVPNVLSLLHYTTFVTCYITIEKYQFNWPCVDMT